MPTNSDIDTEDAKKAGVILGAANLVLWPFYYASSKAGAIASLVVTLGAVKACHDVGAKRRPVENFANNANGFFGGSSTEIGNALQNVVAGGAALYDELGGARPS